MKNALVVVFVSVAIVGILVILFSIQKDVSEYIESDKGERASDENKDVEDGDDIIQTEDGSFLKSSGSGSSGSVGSGGGSSGSGISETSQNCIKQQVAYALKNLETNVSCDSISGVCEAECTLEVVNLDENLAGTFSVRINFFENGEFKEYEILNSYLYAGEQEKISSRKQFNSENIYCTFKSEEIPYREICL